MTKYFEKAISGVESALTNLQSRKIEIRRITRPYALLLMAGYPNEKIPLEVVNACINSQHDDGGFIGNVDTIWNIKFLEYFPDYYKERSKAIQWLQSDNGIEPGFGQNKRDIHRIPVTGLALFLIPEIREYRHYEWLETKWSAEKNGLTYKGAYTILAYMNCKLSSHQEMLLQDIGTWLVGQQYQNGGYGPRKNHPVGTDVRFTSLALLALSSLNNKKYDDAILNGYN